MLLAAALLPPSAPGLAAPDAPLTQPLNCVFLGSSVRSGTARVLVTATGRATAVGTVASRLASAPPETDFARGVRQFGELLLRVMFIVVVAVLVFNQLLGRPAMDSLIGASPPAALADWRYLLVPVAAGLLTFVFHPTVGCPCAMVWAGSGDRRCCSSAANRRAWLSGVSA